MIVTLLVAGSAHAEPLWRESPAGFVRRHIEEMLALSRDAELDVDARHAAARKAVASGIDFGELSRRALGRHWPRMSARQRAEFQEGVRGIVTEVYARQIAQHLGDRAHVVREHVRVLDEGIAGDRATVTLAVLHAGQEIPVEAALSRYRTTWRICDLAIYGVSVGDNLGAQVTRLARGGNYGEVLERLADRKSVLAAARSR